MAAMTVREVRDFLTSLIDEDHANGYRKVLIETGDIWGDNEFNELRRIDGSSSTTKPVLFQY